MNGSIVVPPTAVIVDLDRRFVSLLGEHIPITNIEEVSARGTTIYFESTDTVANTTYRSSGSLDRITGGLEFSEYWEGLRGSGQVIYGLDCRRVTPLVGN